MPLPREEAIDRLVLRIHIDDWQVRRTASPTFAASVVALAAVRTAKVTPRRMAGGCVVGAAALHRLLHLISLTIPITTKPERSGGETVSLRTAGVRDEYRLVIRSRSDAKIMR